MIKAFNKVIILIALLGLSFTSSFSNSNSSDINIEFRGVWVTTVGNTDWPSTTGLSVSEQQNEAIKILDTVKNNNLNAIMLHVRPQSDAFYKSKYEPWSKYLTGIQGQNPGYDPLEFWLTEAHKRGIEVHAWFNPYRANPETKNLDDIPNDAVVHLVKMDWLIPTHEAVKKHVTKVILDVVDNYDIDGVHMDDYFYPYPEDSPTTGFPDQKFYQQYQEQGGKLSLKAWRREAVNDFIQNLNIEIKKSKPYVKFGISPFGIWRPGHPESIEAGVDSFNDLAADSKKWINEGWVDYLVPQLYWPIEQTPQSFRTLLDWWLEQNKQNRHVWPGMYTTNEASKAQVGVDEIINQVNMTRDKISKDKAGHIHFTMNTLLDNTSGMTESLKKSVYQNPAITPSYANILSKPKAPELSFTKSSHKLTSVRSYFIP